jgi:hypothetical protein
MVFWGLLGPESRCYGAPNVFLMPMLAFMGAREAGKSLIFAWCACLKVLYEF